MEEDYAKLGLKIGLEIHQQVASLNKLFCKCPVSKSDEFPLTTKRKLRAVSSELGIYDPAALYEYLRQRVFVYRSNKNTSCLVELDESPPLEINKEALEISLQSCKLLNCKISDEIHVMRKTVIDGSAVSGFQRTSVIGYNGYVNTSFGKIGVQTVCLEEDSATVLDKEKGNIEYRLDRLGIPLIEVATSPEIKSPEHAREVAENIGMLLRSLKVVRGIGSIRQDINVSIKDGERIEIKGFQELEKIPSVIKNEVKRQLSLLEIKNELHKRGVKKISTKPEDVTEIFSNTRCNFVKKAVSRKEKVIALVLPEFKDLLKKKCGDRTFGKELSGYAGAYGYGIIHSDEDLGKYNISEDFENLRKNLTTKERDTVLIIVGEDPLRASRAVLERAEHCLTGVPKETRVADGEGSKYTRPLPGSNRMYPETDVPPVRITKKMLSIKIPKTLDEIEKGLAKKLSKDMARQIVRSPYYDLFEEFSSKTKTDPVIVANMILSYYRELGREGYDTGKLKNEDVLSVLKMIEKNIIDKKALYDSLLLLLQGKSPKDVENKFKLMTEVELEKLVSFAVKNNPGKKKDALMGIIMHQARGKASGKQVANMLKRMV
jgi:glutamyl-tRNA(Gln) amidotransferase subunit E